MASDDRAVVVGITTYPDIGNLAGAEHDALAFHAWLTSPAGGDVPPERVDLIVSSQFQPVAPAAAQSAPTATAIEQAFDRLHFASLGTNGIPRRLGRRLYIYAAGHGAGLPFPSDPDRSDAALLVADATPFNATHVMARIYALYFLNAAVFDEIVVFLDCCRFPYARLSPRLPSYVDANAVGDGMAPRRSFFAFATKWGRTAREKPMGSQSRGIFTTTLLQGLQGAAANPDGTITSSSLHNYLLNHMQDLLTPEEKLDPEMPKVPDVSPPQVELVFGTVKPPRTTVTVSFPPAAAGQLIRLRGDNFQVLLSGTTTAGTPWVCPDLPRGGYLVEIPQLLLERKVTLTGHEGMHHVTL